MCVSNWLALTVENLAEDADDVVSVVSCIMQIMFYISCYSNETTMVMNCDAICQFVIPSKRMYVMLCNAQVCTATIVFR